MSDPYKDQDYGRPKDEARTQPELVFDNVGDALEEAYQRGRDRARRDRSGTQLCPTCRNARPWGCSECDGETETGQPTTQEHLAFIDGVRHEHARIMALIEGKRLTDTSEIDEQQTYEQDEAYNRAIDDCLTAINN